MEGTDNKEVDRIRETMLTTMETMLELQLQAVRSMIKDLDHQPKVVVRKGRRSQSLLSLSLQILEKRGESMHVTEVVDELRQRFGRVVGRDSLSSVFGKAVNDGLVVKTAPATFKLRELEQD